MCADPREGSDAHYERLLAGIYSWMVGDVDAAIDAAGAALRAAGVEEAAPGARALDLGAGIGIHVVALERLGYAVTAIDSSRELLDELAERAPRTVRVHGDLVASPELAPGLYDVVLCMGDTLPHLASEEHARAALASAAAAVAPGGRVLISLRDYVDGARAGDERAIVVRSDERRMLTCLLRTSERHVDVTDVVHERTDGGWTVRASTYRKLRIAPREVAAALEHAGLRVIGSEAQRGMITIVAQR